MRIERFRCQVGRHDQRFAEETAHPGERPWNRKGIPALHSPRLAVTNADRHDPHAGPRREINGSRLDHAARPARAIRRDRQMALAGVGAKHFAHRRDAAAVSRASDDAHARGTDQRAE